MIGKIHFGTRKEWYEFGIKNKYNTRSPTSLKDSENPHEIYFYGKGRREGWKFPYARKRIDDKLYELWSNKKAWQEYGFDRNYNERSPHGLKRSEKIEERSWALYGYNRKWKFPYTYERNDDLWPNRKSWNNFGMKNGYQNKNIRSMVKSQNKTERSWYWQGYYYEWTRKFPFKKMRGIWKDPKSWTAEGEKEQYNKRTLSSLMYSDKCEERYWVGVGLRNGWVVNFPLKHKHHVDKIIARSPKLNYISKLPLSTAERAIIMRATKEFEGRDYSISDIQEKLPSKPRLNLGSLNLGRNGIYDVIVDLARKAPEVYIDPNARLAIMNKLNRYYYARYPAAKHDPAAEEYVIRQAEKDFARLISNVKMELAKQ